MWSNGCRVFTGGVSVARLLTLATTTCKWGIFEPAAIVCHLLGPPQAGLPVRNLLSRDAYPRE